MTTPAERLCSRGWRLRNSMWMVPAVLLFGIATWASFLYIGKRANRRTWTRAAIVYGAIALPAVIIFSVVSDGQKETTTRAEDLAGWPFFIVWIVGIVHAVRVNKEWLTWKAHYTPTTAWSVPPPPSSGRPLPPPTLPQPDPDSLFRGTTPGIHTNQSRATVGGIVELNAATLDELQTQLGLETESAVRILEARSRLGAFTSTDQLITEAGMQPHVFAGLRSRVAVSGGSVQEPRPGRRLEL